MRDALSREWRPTLAIAGPVMLGYLGMMLMGIVDTILVGSLGPVALGAVGVGSSVVAVAFLFGLGLLLGIDRQVAVAHGAGRPDDVARAHAHGIGLALVISLPLVLGLDVTSRHLARFGVAPELVPLAAAWIRVAAWSLVPALVFTAARQSLQALGDTRAATAILLLANGVNAFFNVALIHGRYGLPALGIAGSAWATVIARTCTVVALLAWSYYRGPDLRALERRIHWGTLRELLRLGGPAGVQLVFEGGVFTLATLLCARLGATAAAAHNVALQVASFMFMIPLGVSAAGSVRVGNALGRNDLPGASRAGWSAVAMGAGFMSLSGVMLLAVPGPIIGLFNLDGPSTTIARSLLLCAALFQLFDGCQVTLSGALRGSGDTLASMAANLVGHWFVGLPVGYTLAFTLGYGAVGLWVGLATGLGTVALSLALIWRRRIGRIVRGEILAVPAEGH
jgi:MATE family multidrug resistance protein